MLYLEKGEKAPTSIQRVQSSSVVSPWKPQISAPVYKQSGPEIQRDGDNEKRARCIGRKDSNHSGTEHKMTVQLCSPIMGMPKRAMSFIVTIDTLRSSQVAALSPISEYMTEIVERNASYYIRTKTCHLFNISFLYYMIEHNN